MEKTKIDIIVSQCHAIKLKILELAMSTGKNGAHVGGALSCTELLTTLLYTINSEDSKNRDRVVLSKGHGALALYGALWQNRLMTDDELSGFDKNGTGLFGHPHRDINSGIDYSGGSLGLGVSFAVGQALAFKLNNSESKVYCIAGDGECDEGIVWEALMSASNYRLNNFVFIVDKNNWQSDGPTSTVMDLHDIEAKLKAFGFSTMIINGHDITEVYNAIDMTRESQNPMAIIAETVKGNGVSFLINSKESHFGPLSEKKYQQAVKEINDSYGERD